MPTQDINCTLFTGLFFLALSIVAGCTNSESNNPKSQWFESEAWRSEAVQKAVQGDAVARCLLDMQCPGWDGCKECFSAPPMVEKGVRKCAEQGNCEAQFQLGEHYLLGGHKEGSSDPRDMAEGAEWLRKAAEQGHREANELLEIEVYRDAAIRPVFR